MAVGIISKPSPVTNLEYKDVRGRKIFRANGSAMVPSKGIYTPSTEEEVELCKYFTTIGHLELVQVAKKEASKEEK